MLIDICLARTHAIIAHLIHTLTQEEPQADPWKGFYLRIFIGCDIKKYTAIRENGDPVIHTEHGLYRHGRNRLTDGNNYWMTLSRLRLTCTCHIRKHPVCPRLILHRRIHHCRLICPCHCMIQALPSPQIGNRLIIVGGRAP